VNLKCREKRPLCSQGGNPVCTKGKVRKLPVLKKVRRPLCTVRKEGRIRVTKKKGGGEIAILHAINRVGYEKLGRGGKEEGRIVRENKGEEERQTVIRSFEEGHCTVEKDVKKKMVTAITREKKGGKEVHPINNRCAVQLGQESDYRIHQSACEKASSLLIRKKRKKKRGNSTKKLGELRLYPGQEKTAVTLSKKKKKKGETVPQLGLTRRGGG